MKKQVLATAVKWTKVKKLYTWEQVSEYQRRGWQVVMGDHVEEAKAAMSKYGR